MALKHVVVSVVYLFIFYWLSLCGGTTDYRNEQAQSRGVVVGRGEGNVLALVEKKVFHIPVSLFARHFTCMSEMLQCIWVVEPQFFSDCDLHTHKHTELAPTTVLDSETKYCIGKHEIYVALFGVHLLLGLFCSHNAPSALCMSYCTLPATAGNNPSLSTPVLWAWHPIWPIWKLSGWRACMWNALQTCMHSGSELLKPHNIT